MKKAFKSGLLPALQRAIQLASALPQAHTDAAGIVQMYDERRRASRRRFLRQTGATALGATLLPRFLHRTGAMAPNIAIIGGGIAGLSALHHLKKRGFEQVTIYESSNRTGGRMFTSHEIMGPGTWTELGGEFIDTQHRDMWDLASEFKLELLDMQAESETKLTGETFFFEGRHRTMAQLVEAVKPYVARIQSDIERLPEEINYATRDRYTKGLDQTSISSYLDYVEAEPWSKKMFQVAYEAEYGLSTDVQSSLNFLLLFTGEVKEKHLDMFGESDERYKVKGGNQLIPDALAKRYNSHIEPGRSLVAVRQHGARYDLYFEGKIEPVTVDYVIMTLPFTRLRQVDFAVEMPPEKYRCIQELGYGTNAKLMIGMNQHVWRNAGYLGLCYSDNGVGNGWDNAQRQTADQQSAGLSILFGGSPSMKLNEGTPEQQKDKYLPLWEQIFPGVKAAYNGKSARMHWPTYQHALGSYVCPTLGQYTSIIGLEQQRIGNILFAGEHCGGEFSGFMNGAAKSGREAAEAV